MKKLHIQTKEFLFELALRYVARFEVSQGKLLRYMRMKSADELDQEWTDYVIERLKKLGAINDERVKENLVRSLERRGKGGRAISAKLAEWGLGEHKPDSDAELTRAKEWVLRWRERGIEDKKIASRLAMRGYGWDIVSKALKASNDD